MRAAAAEAVRAAVHQHERRRRPQQLAEIGQTRAITDAIVLLARTGGLGATTLGEMLDAVDSAIESQGLDVLSAPGWPAPGTYSRPRRAELAAALNRLRTLRCQ